MLGGKDLDTATTTSQGTYPIQMFTMYVLKWLFLYWIPILKEYQSSLGLLFILDTLPYSQRCAH